MMLLEKRIQLFSRRKWKEARQNRNTSGNKRRERKVHRHKFSELLKGNQYGSFFNSDVECWPRKNRRRTGRLCMVITTKVWLVHVL